MRTMLTLAVGALLSWASPIAIAADNPEKDDFEQRARTVNRAAEKEAVFKKALHHVSIETGVPESTIEAQHRRNPEIGLAGIMLANVLSAETKKDSSEFIKGHKSGKSWLAMAKANNVAVEKLTLRLENLDKAIGASAAKPAKKTPDEPKPQP